MVILFYFNNLVINHWFKVHTYVSWVNCFLQEKKKKKKKKCGLHSQTLTSGLYFKLEWNKILMKNGLICFLQKPYCKKVLHTYKYRPVRHTPLPQSFMSFLRYVHCPQESVSPFLCHKAFNLHSWEDMNPEKNFSQMLHSARIYQWPLTNGLCCIQTTHTVQKWHW